MIDVRIEDAQGRPLGRLRERRRPGLAGLALAALARTRLAEALPFELGLESPDGAPLAVMRRGIALLRPGVEVEAPSGAPLGRLRERLWASGGPFDVLGRDGRRIAALRAGSLADDAGRVLARSRPGPMGEVCVELGDGAGALGQGERLLVLAAAAFDGVRQKGLHGL